MSSLNRLVKKMVLEPLSLWKKGVALYFIAQQGGIEGVSASEHIKFVVFALRRDFKKRYIQYGLFICPQGEFFCCCYGLFFVHADNREINQ